MWCPDCPPVREARALFFESFWPNLGTVVVPLVVVLTASAWIVRRRLGPVPAAGVVLGIGLGGFVDGILLHQILQWHEMFSSVVPVTDVVGMKYNMIWDGMFHALTWAACAIGIGLLFHAGRRNDAVWSGRLLVGSMLAGWGMFNLVEGVLDHLVLGIHHVRPGATQTAWDWGFVVVGGAGFMLAGYLISRDAGERRRAAATRGG
ncbi:MAG TPA: DUF2243 domain-containing protein [Kofleriaceae bacterium]|nr:DUF2243 domain-containing protein [Kofleriaceae bacterium]